MGLCGASDISGFRAWGFRVRTLGVQGLGLLGVVGLRAWEVFSLRDETPTVLA